MGAGNGVQGRTILMTTPPRLTDAEISAMSVWFEQDRDLSDGMMFPDFDVAIRQLLADNARLRGELADAEAAVRAGFRAIGSHNAPDDCYATGPMTGNMIEDLVICPACDFINAHAPAITRARERRG
jgi:hypothetical protein